MQWVQDPTQSNVDNLNNVRREASRHFRNKKGYLKAKIEELETNSKIKNIRGLDRSFNDFKRRVIWLQTATVFWIGGGTISLSY